jgi:mRNA interferase MazF
MVEQGDIIWVDFSPQAGHEQKGRRPALVVSNKTFNDFSKMIIACPITNNDKAHPFHVKLDDRTTTKGVILCDQVKTMDIYARKFEFSERIPDDILQDVVNIVTCFFEKA